MCRSSNDKSADSGHIGNSGISKKAMGRKAIEKLGGPVTCALRRLGDPHSNNNPTMTTPRARGGLGSYGAAATQSRGSMLPSPSNRR